jgi:antitoxin (DNA-binding transcriptional repressor) of toxin-antitoxin stability system
MSTVTLEEAQAKLPELIAQLTPGEEMIITRNQQPVARLVRAQHAVRQPRQPGSAQGKLVILVEDEAHLEDFTDYMP